jgi:hypothetical protein
MLVYNVCTGTGCVCAPAPATPGAFIGEIYSPDCIPGP